MYVRINKYVYNACAHEILNNYSLFKLLNSSIYQIDRVHLLSRHYYV